MAVQALLPYLPYAVAAAQGLGQYFEGRDLDKFQKKFKKEQQRRNLISALSEGRINLQPGTIQPEKSTATKLFQGLGTAGQWLNMGLQLQGQISKDVLERDLLKAENQTLLDYNKTKDFLGTLGSNIGNQTPATAPQIQAQDPAGIIPEALQGMPSFKPMGIDAVGDQLPMLQPPAAEVPTPAPTPAPAGVPQVPNQLGDIEQLVLSPQTTLQDLVQAADAAGIPPSPGRSMALGEAAESRTKAADREFSQAARIAALRQGQVANELSAARLEQTQFDAERNYQLALGRYDNEVERLRMDRERLAYETAIDPAQKETVRIVNDAIQRNPLVSSYPDYEQFYSRLAIGYGSGTAAGEQEQINATSRIRDIGSAVLKGEYEIPAEAEGPLSRLVLMADNILNDEGFVMTDETRQEFYELSTQVYNAMRQQAEQFVDNIEYAYGTYRGFDTELARRQLEAYTTIVDRQEIYRDGFFRAANKVRTSEMSMEQKQAELLDIQTRFRQIYRDMGYTPPSFLGRG